MDYGPPSLADGFAQAGGTKLRLKSEWGRFGPMWTLRLDFDPFLLAVALVGFVPDRALLQRH